MVFLISVPCQIRHCSVFGLSSKLLQNHFVNFNQLGKEDPWVKGIQVYSNEELSC